MRRRPWEGGNTLSLTAYIGLITLAPLALAAIIFVLGAVGRATWRLVLALGIVGALIPAIGLLLLAPSMAAGEPIAIQPFGTGSGFGAWVAPTYRLDAFGLYTAIGVAFLVTPLLLWLAFADQPGDAAERMDDSSESDESDESGEARDLDTSDATETADAGGDAKDEQDAGDDAGDDADEADEAGETQEPATASGIWAALEGPQGLAIPALWRGVAWTLALEMLALTAALADSVVLLGVSWALLALVAWALGEAASDRTQLDWKGFGVMLAGPVLWLLIVLFPASGAHTPRLFSLTGATAFSVTQCILLAVAVALAGGAYPFMAWVRRRAAFATPAGVGAVLTVLIPAALYVGLRTYGAAASVSNVWPIFGTAPSAPTTPAPVTAGIAFAVLGTATVIIAGLLALGQRDARALTAYLAIAQFGWGMVGVGIGQPISIFGVVILLPSVVLGLGAMLAALTASGVVSSDMEPESSSGPRAADAPLRPLGLAAWSIGAMSLLGVPLLAGFAPRHLIVIGAIQINGLGIPLLGLCWAGDVLLALALLRAVAPALSSFHLSGASGESSTAIGIEYAASDIPAVILALLALAIGMFPALLTWVFASTPAAAILGPRAVAGLITSSALGYTTAAAQWLSAIAWIVVVVVAAGLVIARARTVRATSPVFASGHSASSERTATAKSVSASDESTTEETVSDAGAEKTASTLVSPTDAWADLRPVFDSPWVLPGGNWLLSGTDDEGNETTDEGADAEDDESDDEERDAADETEDESSVDGGEMSIPAGNTQKGEEPRDDE